MPLANFFLLLGRAYVPVSDQISGRSDAIDMITAMEIAVLVCDGVFDSGLAAILDVLTQANVVGEQVSQSPSWNVTTGRTRPSRIVDFSEK
jgi:hypothetical protein